MAADDNPYRMRALAAQLLAIGDQGYALAEAARKVAEGEADRKRVILGRRGSPGYRLAIAPKGCLV